jgi:hypothetical protein
MTTAENTSSFNVVASVMLDCGPLQIPAVERVKKSGSSAVSK